MTCDICAGGDVETTTIVCDECLDHQHWLRFCEAWVAIGLAAFICSIGLAPWLKKISYSTEGAT